MAKEIYVVMCNDSYYDTLIGAYSNESEAKAEADGLNAEVERKKKRFMELSKTCTYYNDWPFIGNKYDEETLEYCRLYEWCKYSVGACKRYVVKKTSYCD